MKITMEIRRRRQVYIQHRMLLTLIHMVECTVERFSQTPILFNIFVDKLFLENDVFGNWSCNTRAAKKFVVADDLSQYHTYFLFSFFDHLFD